MQNQFYDCRRLQMTSAVKGRKEGIQFPCGTAASFVDNPFRNILPLPSVGIEMASPSI